MNETPTTSILNAPTPARWFWAAAVAGYVWYLMNALAFFFRLLVTDGNIQIVDGGQMMAVIPPWVNVLYAGEVFAGALGCVGLLLRRKWAPRFFVLSVAGAIGQSVYVHLLSGTARLIGTPAAIMPMWSILIGASMIALSRSGIARGWLR